MKKFVLLIILFVLLFPGSVLSKEWPARTDVPLDKCWTITFNKPVDKTSISDLSVYVMSSDKCVNTILKLSDDRKTVTVSPFPNYLPNQTYTLFIHKYITSSGKQLGDTSQLIFTTVSN